MTRRAHLTALARLVEQALDTHVIPRARRLLDVELAWVERRSLACTTPKRRESIRIRRVIESCRDKHLANLDADEGLAVIGIAWEEVALELRKRRRERAAVSRRRCRRCEARMEQRDLRGERRASWSTRVVYRCPACGLTSR